MGNIAVHCDHDCEESRNFAHAVAPDAWATRRHALPCRAPPAGLTVFGAKRPNILDTFVALRHFDAIEEQEAAHA